MSRRVFVISSKVLGSLLVVFLSYSSFLRHSKPIYTPLLLRSQNSNYTLNSQVLNTLNLRVWNTVLSVLSLLLNLLSFAVVGWFGYKAFQAFEEKINSFSSCDEEK